MYSRPVKPGSDVRLNRLTTRAPHDLGKDEAKKEFQRLATELGELQELLFAADTHALLVVFQGMDTSGKDGGIRDVFSDVNAAGCRVASFKVPSATELAHDFLWRVHQQTPERGHIAVFNRSHYEDVLIVRVHDLVPKSVWSRRYDEINAFERQLTANGTIVLKFFLHISREEQKERLLAREANPAKSWKLSVDDWKERERWNAYQRAYADAISRCSTEDAPWFVIPADQKWFRNLAVTERIVKTLRPFAPAWRKKLTEIGKQETAALVQARADGIIEPIAEADKNDS